MSNPWHPLMPACTLCAVVARNPPADIRQVLASYEGHEIPAEFIRRSKEHQR